MSTSGYSARRTPVWLSDSDRARAVPVEVWITGVLVVIAAVIRIIVLNDQSLWQDEALTAYEAQLPLGAMLNTVVHIETTPPLYFVVIWAWAHVFGNGAVALRSVSMLAGVALVPIAYLAGRDLVSPRAGVIAAAFVTFNPFLIWYSQEARAYMLLAALSGASFLWFVRARRDPAGRNLAWWAVWSSLALMTHFFAGFLVAPEAVWLLWVAYSRPDRVGGIHTSGMRAGGIRASGMRAGAIRTRGMRAAGAAVGVVALVQAAMLPFALIDTGHGVGWIAQTPREIRLSQAISEWGVSILYRRTTVHEGLLGGAALLVIVALLLVFTGDARTRRGAAVAAVIGGFVWVAPFVLGLLGHDYFLSRNLIPAVVPFGVVIAPACAAPRARPLGTAFAVGLVALFAYATIRVQTTSYLQRPDWRAVAHALGPATVPRAILAANGTTATPLKIYLPRVNWVQNQSQRVAVAEVDVIGDIKRLPLRPIRIYPPKQPAFWFTPIASPVPRSVDVAGARIVDRFRVDNWIVARYALYSRERVSVKQLLALAPRYFRRTPNAMLVFFQPADR